MGTLSLLLMGAGAVGWGFAPMRWDAEFHLWDVFPLMFAAGGLIGLWWLATANGAAV